MRKVIYLVLAMLAMMPFMSCDNSGNTPTNAAVRTVYSISEENISGSGGFAEISQLQNIGDDSQMPLIVVYGDQRSSSLLWYPLSNYIYWLEEGKVYIDTSLGDSDFYRIVVIK
jgi:hypothetical protein